MFGISDWVSPSIYAADWKSDVDRRMKEFADANFTVMLGGMGISGMVHLRARVETWNASTLVQLKAAEKYGIKMIPGVPVTGAINRTSGVSDIKLQSDIDPKITSSPAFWGFDFYDEPNTNVFPALANLSRQVGAAFPSKVRFINLLPNYADPVTQLMAKNYTNYVSKFVTSMVAGGAGPDILCMDHYPFFEYPAGSNLTSSVAGYRANLGVLRAESLRAGIPFWNFFNNVGWSTHSDPTEAQMRWQVFTSLAYGAKGVLYYCYNSEPCGRGGVLHDKGQPNHLQKGRHYADATRINSVLKVFGKYLVTATSTAVYRVQPAGSQDTGYTNTCAVGEPDCPMGEQPSSDLTSCVLFNITAVAVSPIRPGNGLLIGQFKLADGRTAVLLQNQNWDMTLWPAFQTKAPIELSAVLEVDPSSGTESLLQDDEPGVVGARAGAVSLDLAAGSARLLIMPPHARPLKTDDGIPAAAATKHLLVDMHELESISGAAFTMNPPFCDRAPVLEPDAPWEIAANFSLNVYHSVVAEPSGLVRLWYNILNDSNVDAKPYLVGYAESIDGGRTFTKPILNQFSLNGSTSNNIIGPGMSTPMHEGCSVWVDQTASLGGRYVSQAKCASGCSGLGFSTSTDGKVWKEVKGWPAGEGGCDTQSNVFADPWTGDFALFTRNWVRSPPEYRTIRRLSCGKGKLNPASVSSCWSDQQIVMQPDALDRCHIGEACTKTNAGMNLFTSRPVIRIPLTRVISFRSMLLTGICL